MTKHQHMMGAVDRVWGLDRIMKGAHLTDLSTPSDKLSEEKRDTCAARSVANLSEKLTAPTYSASALSWHMFYIAGNANILKCVSTQCPTRTSKQVEDTQFSRHVSCALSSSVSLQRIIQYELIFRLLLKVTVDWPRECNSIQFMRGALLSWEVRSSISIITI